MSRSSKSNWSTWMSQKVCPNTFFFLYFAAFRYLRQIPEGSIRRAKLAVTALKPEQSKQRMRPMRKQPHSVVVICTFPRAVSWIRKHMWSRPSVARAAVETHVPASLHEPPISCVFTNPIQSSDYSWQPEEVAVGTWASANYGWARPPRRHCATARLKWKCSSRAAT